MKKMILSAAAFALVAVSSIALAPTTASAIPAFARQTGAACLSCHFQTFPALKPFGRAFKMGSFTDVGDQALVEDDDLSIPAVLNASFVVRANYINTNVTGQASVGTYNIPTDDNLLIAGRLGTNSGVFLEFNGGANNWQLMNSFDVAGFKVGISAADTGFGATAAMEVSNVFGQHGGKLGGKNISAIDAAGFGQDTSAIAAWIGNDLGYVQFALVAPKSATVGTVNVGTSFAKLVRIVATLDVGGWDTLVGFGTVTGSAAKGDNSTGGGVVTNTNVRVPMDMQFVDAQIQGEVGDMSVGVYGDWAHAKGKSSTVGTANFYGGQINTTTNDKGDYNAYSIRGEIKPLDRVLFGIGYGYQKSSPGGVATDITVKTFHLAATYEIYQNFEFNVVFDNAKQNDQTGASLNNTALGSETTRTTVIEVEALL